MHAQAGSLATLLRQLEQLEFGNVADLQAAQNHQLLRLTAHCAQQSPQFQQRLNSAALRPEQLILDTLHHLPPLQRGELVSADESLFCSAVPDEHHPVGNTQTSGSTGQPVVVRRTALNQSIWMANVLREHQWWKRDLKATLGVVSWNLEQDTIHTPDWGPPASLMAQTGPAHACHVKLDTQTIAAWIIEKSPHYLTIFPNCLADIVEIFDSSGVRPKNLRQIRCVGECLSDSLRQHTKDVLDVDIVDVYSSQEMGVIAMQCPTSGLFHTMSETSIIEVLNDDGKPCQPGEVGELVVTDLNNYATPLLRYALADHAEVGEPCNCGRSLPTLKRIIGRSRQMVKYPDGTKRWLLGLDPLKDAAPILQFQITQETLYSISATFVVKQALDENQTQQLTHVIQRALGYPFHILIKTQTTPIARGTTGKFEEFICLI